MPDRTPTKALCLGVLYPGDGTDTEILHLERWLPAHGIAGVAARVERPPSWGGHGREALLGLGSAESLRPFALRLAEAGCGALVWACTSGSFVGGLGWAHDQSRGLTAATGLPATSATLAMIQAARALGATVVDVLGAYPEPITASFVACLRDCGIRVADTASLDAADGLASYCLDIMGELKRFSERRPGRAYPLLLPDTAIDTLDALARLERIAGRTVIAASQACVWQGLKLLGVAPVARDAGTLFRLARARALAAAPPA